MYKSALVLGLGVSGYAVSRLLLREGTLVTVFDDSHDKNVLRRGKELRKNGVHVIIGLKIEFKRYIKENYFDVCIISPGIPPESNYIKVIKSMGIEILTELELGASRCKSKILAITGTNGKSTLVKLCGETISLNGHSVVMAGNYGLPLCDVANRKESSDWLVVEASSFQMEWIRNFRPAIGVIVNIQPDHLDRHGDMSNYKRIKARIFKNMRGSDIGIIPHENMENFIGLEKGISNWVSFGLSEYADYRYSRGIVYNKDRSIEVSLSGTIFDNEVMGNNAAAAIAAVNACGLDGSMVAKAVKTFKPLPYRMMDVTIINGVKFINDSKATNLAAMDAGLKMVNKPVRLISGGVLKEKNLGLAKESLVKKVRKVYLIGASAKDMKKNWKDIVPSNICMYLEKALKEAWHDSEEGEVIMLSPGCASFDQFKDFEDRGTQFNRFVKTIKKEYK